MTQLDRITQQADVMAGKPCIRGMRVTVGVVVGQISAGRSVRSRSPAPDEGFGGHELVAALG